VWVNAAGVICRPLLGQSLSHLERGRDSPSPRLWLSLMERLAVPVKEAVEVYLEHGQPTLPQLIQLGRLLALRGHTDQARSVLLLAQQRLRAENLTRPQRHRAELFEAYGILHYQNGKVRACLNAFTAALNERRKVLSEPYDLAKSFYQLGNVLLREGDYAAARALLSRAVWLVQRLNPAECPVKTERVIRLHEWVVKTLGIVMLYQRDVYAAWAMYEQARFSWEMYGILAHPSPWLCNDMALAAIGVGQFDRARELLHDVLAAASEEPDLAGAAHNNLGLLYRLTGDVAKAREHQLKAWELFGGSDHPRSIPVALELAHLALQEANGEEAAEWLARVAAEDSADPVLRLEYRLLRAKLARLNGEYELADRLLQEIMEAAEKPLVQELLARVERVRLHAHRSEILDEELNSIEALLARIHL